jgi:hypothetical protein
MMSLAEVGKLIVEVGILPAVIAALIYLIWKLINEMNKDIVSLTCALSENTSALNMLTEFVRGKSS